MSEEGETATRGDAARRMSAEERRRYARDGFLRSEANRSDRPRRTLLPSYQPAGRIRWHEVPLHLDWVERLP